MTDNNPAGQRGPAEHERRDQILELANELFSAHGYRKTSVTDIAKAVGVSSAYLYRFFDSKQAIGEAVCAMTLAKIDVALTEIAERDDSATQRPRDLLDCLLALFSSRATRLYLHLQLVQLPSALVLLLCVQ